MLHDILHGHSKEAKSNVLFLQDTRLPNMKYVVFNCIFSAPVQTF